MQRLSSLVLMTIACSCGADTTEVVVVVEAEASVAERARFLAVRVYDSEGSRIVDRVDDIPAGTTFPARIPLTPREGDASRSWRVEVDAQTAFGCVFSTVMAEGGYEAGRAETRMLELSHIAPDPCPLGPGCMGDCDDGLACTDDSCVEERCLNTVAAGQCAIDGACLGLGASSGGDPCLSCNPDTSPNAWSLAPGCDSAEVARLDDGAMAMGRYGQAVAIADGSIVVGAPEAGGNDGQAFAFRLGTGGLWTFDGELAPREVAAGAQVGTDVDVSGDWAVVGAPYDGAGRVFMFRRSAASGWAADQELTSPTLSDADRFGASVAIDGDLVVVGATHVEAPFGESGAVWVFRRSAENRWLEIANVEPPDPQRGAYFGGAVALSGSRFVAGSQYYDKGSMLEMESAGTAYAFELTGDAVSQGVELAPPTVQAAAFFGHEVAIDGGRVAVTATQDNQFANDGGAVYVFDLAGGVAELVDELGMGPAGGQAGLGLAISDRYVAVGFPFFEDGFVTLFEDTGGSFAGLPRIEASDMVSGGFFGRSIGAWQHWMVIGAPNRSDGATAGAIYVHELRR